MFHLRRTLLSWLKSSDTPDRIVIMFSCKYLRAALSAHLLEGRDARVFAILDDLAGELGMCLGLLNVKHTKQGSGRDRRREERESH
jgi:hypothetical protein